MEIFLKLKTWLITFSIIILGIALSFVIVYVEYKQEIKIIEAGSGDNISGYAWNENFGWVSFNCSNDSSCATIDYGVNIDADTGNFSGYAWSENAGWIDFAPIGPYPESPQNSANYNSATGAVTGWAKILSLGDDGWLKMSGIWSSGVSIDASGDFHGWAWNGNSDDSGLGWLSFNCLDIIGMDICAISNYAVHGEINVSPEVVNLSAPNWNFSQSCSTGARKAFLRWEFSDIDDGSYQTAYQIILDDDSDIADPILDTDKVDSGVFQYALDANYLDYNTAYYWWIRVWDDNDAASDWVQYDNASDTDNDDGDNLTFTTYKHEFPGVNFEWSPLNPSIGDDTIFTDQTEVYGGSVLASLLWQVPVGAAINDTTTSTPTVVFSSSGNQSVNLKATDSDGYYCDLSQMIDANMSSPCLIEIAPCW